MNPGGAYQAVIYSFKSYPHNSIYPHFQQYATVHCYLFTVIYISTVSPIAGSNSSTPAPLKAFLAFSWSITI